MKESLARRRNARLLNGIDLAQVRRDCGIAQLTIARALGVSNVTVAEWERRRNRPPDAYARVVAGMLRHLEVPRG